MMPRTGIKIEKEDNATFPAEHTIQGGRWIHRIRQSDIKRFEHCPESHRRHLLGLDPPLNNDSAILGTIFALYPEARINGEHPTPAWANVRSELASKWNEPGLNQVTFNSLDHATSLLQRACNTWETEVFPKVPKGSIPEQRFSVKAYEDDKRVIVLEGTSDLWLSPMNTIYGQKTEPIWDWKFSGRNYIGQHAWKNERYDPQPVHYCLARSLVEKATCDDFTFVNIRRDDTKGMKQAPVVEWLPVKLTLGDFQFHIERLYKMARFIEKMGFDEGWTLNPTDWWCSSTWCPSWSECRGRHLGQDPWGNLAKRLKNG